MSDSFDAYYKWLGIPPQEQPPNAYRLLGISKYEDDPEVIESAADRQMAHVKTQASGPHVSLSQKMLNKLATARTCLLDEEKRAQYDDHLRQQDAVAGRRAAELASSTSNSSTSVVAADADGDRPIGPDSDNSPAPSAADRVPKKTRKELSLKTKLLGHVAAPLVGLVVGYVVLCWLAPSRDIFHIFSDRAAETELREDVDREPREVVRHEHRPEQVRVRKPTVTTRQTTGPQTVVEPELVLEPPPDSTPDPKPIEETPEPVDAPLGDPIPATPAHQPFAGLDAHVELPAIDDREPMTVGTIRLPPGERLQMRLTAAPLADALKSRIESEPAGESGEGESLQSWMVYLISKIVTGSSDAGRLPIARFFLQGELLKFQWSSHSRSASAAQLRNCMMTATVGNETYQLALRKPQQLPPLKLQMEETVSRITFRVPDCPPSERIYLELLSASQLGPLRNRETLAALVSFGDRIELHYSSATLTVRMVERRDELAVEMTGRYKIGEREYPFATERLKKHVLSSQKSLQESLADGRRCEAEAYKLNRQISSLASRSFSNSPGSVVARRQRDQQLASLRGQASRNSKKLARLKERVPELQAILRELPDVVALTNRLRDGCSIHFRVVLMLEQEEVDLAVTSDEVRVETAVTSSPPESARPSPRVKLAIETLEANPDDPQANLLVGSYYCLEVNDWVKGAPFLARCGDERLRSVVELDTAGAAETAAQVVLADAWYDWAEADSAKRGFLARAAYWYLKARDDTGGLRRLKIDKRLETIDAALRDL